MSDYIGKICPFCKTEFRSDDEIVVCSQCDMPHHKECWIENQGCTTFGCLGTIRSADQAATSVTTHQMTFEDAAAFCTACGAPLDASAAFCSKCGNRVGAQTLPPPISASSPPQANQSAVDAELSLLVGKNAEYYLPKFQELNAQGRLNSWNWAAFFFAPYWMLYRKMYGYGAGFLAAVFVMSLIESNVLSLLSIGGYIVLGILGNGIYLKQLERKAAQAKLIGEPIRTQFLAQNGGVNSKAVVLGIVCYALLTILLSI